MSRKKIAWVVAGILILACLTLFVIRDALLGWAIGKVSNKLNDHYNAQLSVGQYEMTGLRTVSLKEVFLIPEGGDTLLAVKRLSCKLSWSGLFRLRPVFSTIELDTATLSLVKRDTTDNFRFLLKRRDAEVDAGSDGASTIGYDERIGHLLDLVFEWFDTEISINRLALRYTRGKLVEELLLPQLFLQSGQFQSSLVSTSTEGVALWLARGEFDTGARRFNVSIRRNTSERIALPFFDLLDGLKVTLDSAHVQLAEVSGEHSLDMKTSLDVFGLQADHWRISKELVKMPVIQFNLQAYADPDSSGLSKGSSCMVGKVPLQVQLDLIRQPERRLRAHAGFNLVQGGDLFASLPSGMFTSIRGLKARGGLDFSFFIDLPIDRPEALQLDCGMKPAGFRIESYGSENFSRINQPFSFLAMDGERPVRSFSVGPDNPVFTPLDQIAPALRNAVLICEDPSFFQHAGFVAESFRESMATNIRQRRFARGGSTISMQLVKNVFLSRNKSVSRKLEEIMIVWLMERNHLVSKERMFEIYLNIIEWGPDVYGIGEASRFYFSKSPDQLTLEESIFLASIVPSPKAFRYRFGPDGRLKASMDGFYRQVASRMVRKEMIPQELSDGIQSAVQLTGPAALLIQPADTLTVDTLELLPELPLQVE